MLSIEHEQLQGLTTWTVWAEDTNLIFRGLAVVIGAMELIVAQNEQYKGQGQLCGPSHHVSHFFFVGQ
jgi:hypothetical protein